MSVLKLLTNYQPKYDQRKTTKQTGKILMEVLWIFTRPLENYQDPQADGLYQGIGKLPRPAGGWTLSGRKYTGPYNDLENQVRYNPETGEILEIYDQPTGPTDAVAMQHDIDYIVCGDNRKCKNKADRKMVKSLDAIPYSERQWGHWLARNLINTKQKLGLGLN